MFGCQNVSAQSNAVIKRSSRKLPAQPWIPSLEKRWVTKQ